MKFYFMVLALLALPPSALAADISFRAGSDYQISLPDNWVEIPKEALEQFGKAASEAVGQIQTYEYGYQPGENKNWLEHPYVLVKVNRNGRVPEGQLKQYKKIASDFEEGLNKLEQAAGDFLSNMAQGEALYDPDIHTLWSHLSMDVAGVGRVRGITAVKLTEKGFIQFMGYALEQDFSKYEPLYRKMVHRIKLEEKDIYKPRITDHAPTVFGINLGQVAIAALVGGLIGGLFCLFKKFMKKDA